MFSLAFGNIGKKLGKALFNLDCSGKAAGRNRNLEQSGGKSKLVPSYFDKEDVLKNLLQNTQSVFLSMPVLKKTIQDLAQRKRNKMPKFLKETHADWGA